MNIFVLHKKPEIAAKHHCDKHVVKMIVETSQLLSNAHHYYMSPYISKVYRYTHKSHPCTLWVQESEENYNWTYRLFKALCKEYTKRYGKVHASWRKLANVLKYNPCAPGKLTNFALAMPEQYKSDCPVKSYRDYYNNEKAYFAKWNYSKVPNWFEVKNDVVSQA